MVSAARSFIASCRERGEKAQRIRKRALGFFFGYNGREQGQTASELTKRVGTMDAERLQEISERDQLWASLRALLPEIELLAADAFSDSPRERQLIGVLARIVVSELKFRAERSVSE